MRPCNHDLFDAKNTFVVEANVFAGTRIRCKRCGKRSYIGTKGKVEPQTSWNEKCAVTAAVKRFKPEPEASHD